MIDLNRKDVREAAENIIDACSIFYNEGMWEIFGEGHPSCRIRDGAKDVVLMPGHVHPFGKGMGDIKSIEDLVFLDLEGNVLDGKLEPMEASPIHLCVYKHRKDVNAVVYLHPPYSDLFCELNVSIPQFAKQIPIFDTRGELTSMKVADRYVRKFGKRNVVMLRNLDSLICMARNLPQAVAAGYSIEKTAKRQYLAMAVGKIPTPKSWIDHRTGKLDERFYWMFKIENDMIPETYLYLKRKLEQGIR